jgi:hypothetical protein
VARRLVCLLALRDAVVASRDAMRVSGATVGVTLSAACCRGCELRASLRCAATSERLS